MSHNVELLPYYGDPGFLQLVIDGVGTGNYFVSVADDGCLYLVSPGWVGEKWCDAREDACLTLLACWLTAARGVWLTWSAAGWYFYPRARHIRTLAEMCELW